MTLYHYTYYCENKTSDTYLTNKIVSYADMHDKKVVHARMVHQSWGLRGEEWN